MRLLDANVLLCIQRRLFSSRGCRAWLESAFNDANEIIGLPWQTILAFVRIATNPRTVTQPLSSAAAHGIVNQWLSRPSVTTVGYGEHLWELFSQQVAEGKVSGPLVTDAALAAIALEQGATLYSTDKDFRRFPAAEAMVLYWTHP